MEELIKNVIDKNESKTLKARYKLFNYTFFYYLSHLMLNDYSQDTIYQIIGELDKAKVIKSLSENGDNFFPFEESFKKFLLTLSKKQDLKKFENSYFKMCIEMILIGNVDEEKHIYWKDYVRTPKIEKIFKDKSPFYSSLVIYLEDETVDIGINIFELINKVIYSDGKTCLFRDLDDVQGKELYQECRQFVRLLRLNKRFEHNFKRDI